MKERTRSLAVDPQNPQVVYAGTTSGLYRSQDGGSSWEFLYGKELTINAVAVNPRDLQTVYLGAEDVGVLKSANGGKEFAKANVGLICRSVAAFLVDRTSPSQLLMGVLFDNSEGGLFRSRDGGRSWDSSNDGVAAPDRNVYALLQMPNEAQSYLAGTASGLFLSQDGAATWTRVAPQLISGTIVTIAGASSGGRHLVLAGGPAGLFASADGRQWRVFPLGEDLKPVSVVAFPSNNPDQILVGMQGQIWITDDGGEHWRISRIGLPSVTMQALSCPRGWDDAWFLGNRYGIYRSTDRGHNWDHVSSSLGAADVIAFTSFPASSASMALLLGKNLSLNSAEGQGKGLGPIPGASEYESEPTTLSWIIAADALSGNLLISSDNGNSWQRTALAFAGSRIQTLWVERASGLYLFAGTASDGLYFIDLSPFEMSNSSFLHP
jgi:photosystem II stability/assembly factor-like uncharacterized protein